MSNSIAPGSSADVNVRVTALTTNPNVPAQYKTIILKKNLVNGVNTLTQAMISATNTKYVIKYDYTLGEDITVPSGCVLEFDGGSISGEHTLTGTNTEIDAGLINIFNTNVTLTGSWNVAEAYPEWFGAKGDGVTDDNTPIQKTINCFRKIAFASNKVYGFSNIEIPSNRDLYGGGRLLWLVTPTQGGSYFPIHTTLGTRVNNVSIHDLTFDGNENNAGISDSVYNVCDTLTISGNNIEVYNCEFVNNVDSGIMFSECKQSQIHHNHIKTATDAGIYVNANDIDDGMDCFSIHNNIIENCSTAIAMKRITSYGVVNNNIINNCYGGITLENASTSTDFSKQIDICNNYIKNLTGGYGINVRGGYNHNVIGNRIEANATADNSEVVVIDSCQNVNFNSNIIYSTRSNSVIVITQRDINYPVKDININNNIVKHSNTYKSLLLFSNIQASDTEFKNVNIVGNIFDGDIQINYSFGLKNFIISNNKSSVISFDSDNASEILINNNDSAIDQSTIILIRKEISYGGRVQRTYITYHKSYADSFQFKTGDKLILADAFESFEYMYLATGDGLGSSVLTKKISFA